ncbi:hypothetical protein GOP47_0001902 [Adiantum capillus-veneris]|uniref:C2H2-type domain-containing protein n=1 Tax=Adiantum capillus-veneris TaxID=13818 RepID=A0A9D4V9U7_ADICA|nr:hypothetical protein GOP47_0001902 [Adiantum capillus-veneris]
MPPSAWVAWRRILSCKQDSHVSVYDPKGTASTTNVNGRQVPTNKGGVARPNVQSSHNHIKGHGNTNQAKKRRSTSSSVCCNDLKNVVHGNTRVMHRGDQDSPLSHHHSSPHQLKVLLQEPSLLYSPRIDLHVSSVQRSSAHHGKKSSTSCYDCSIASCEPSESFSPKSSNGFQARENGNWYPASTCHKCGDSISDTPDALEEHYTTHHAVTELKEGDSARSIVEIIFQTSWLRQDIVCARPERIFKVHNSPRTIAKFEDYREMVKLKASKISKRQSRCLVDGNELLRFYSTTVTCRMGKTCLSTSSSSPWTTSLCASATCGVCQILKHGFPTQGQPGIYTNASSSQAHDTSMCCQEYDTTANAKRAMLVCRVIAGRVKKSGYESSQDGPISGYDSVAGEAGVYTDLDELLVFNNKAVLPCFVAVYSC